MTGTMRWCWIGLVGVIASGGLALFTHNPRMFFIKSVVGDRVHVEMTPYDLSKGRIIFREKTPGQGPGGGGPRRRTFRR